MPLFEIPPGPFDAYLFDCDGTIADSMPLHHQVWLEALRPWQCDFPESLFYEWAGVPIGEVIKRLNDQFKKEMPIEETILAREALYHQFLAQITGVKEVVEQVHLMFGKIPLAVVSGSPRVSVVKTLETLGLLDRFDALV
ncbi:MAG: HAD family phosphatase, partial [Proteobacteria bacterium]